MPFEKTFANGRPNLVVEYATSDYNYVYLRSLPLMAGVVAVFRLESSSLIVVHFPSTKTPVLSGSGLLE